MPTSPIRIAVFVSGEGTNLENIIRYFSTRPLITVALVVSNRPDAKALERARNHGIASIVMSRDTLVHDAPKVIDILHGIDYIILAGFLLRIPAYLIEAFPQRILNLHPSLLPKYGGKGMYGHHVHEAVCAAGETETGITVHYVTEGIDEGAHIAQFSTALCPESETPDSIAAKIHELEQRHFPEVIEEVVTSHLMAGGK